MATVEHVLNGEGVPVDSPPSLCAHYIDTLTGQQYTAAGVSWPEDWRLVACRMAETIIYPATVDIHAGVSHVRALAVGPPQTLTLNIAHRTHTMASADGDPIHAALDIEIVQDGDNYIGTIAITSPGVAGARVIGGADLGATVDGDTVRIPSRPAKWQALLRAVVAGDLLSIYVLATDPLV